jgi:arylsulfatase A-like enzyme
MTVKKLLVILFMALLIGCAKVQMDADRAVESVQRSDNRPNFITFIIDDMGFSDLGSYGGEISTPNIDALAADGVMLTDFHSAPTSTPARSMLFSGMDNHHTGYGTMSGFVREEQKGKPGYEFELSRDFKIYPEMLRDNGYQTMMTGKWDVGEEPGQYATDRGFTNTKALLLPGGDVHYSEPDGKIITSKDSEFYKKLSRTSPYNENGKELKKFSREFYSPDYYTDSGIEMLEERDKSKPFYLNISHIAVHCPLQAPENMVQKYIGTYSRGWDVLRQERFDRQKKLGLFPADAVLPDRPDIVQWNSLDSYTQKVQARKMAVYAAMVDSLDQNVGKLIAYLKKIGEYENTVFIVFSDNGAAYRAPAVYEKGRGDYIRSNFFTDEDFKKPENYKQIGSRYSYSSYGKEWSMLCNAPFNQTKGTTFEGGIHTPAIVHYPGSKVSGVKMTRLVSVMDISHTILDMAGIEQWNASFGTPDIQRGVSFANIFDGIISEDPERVIGWEFNGRKGLRKGNWKLSQHSTSNKVYLFNLKDDPFESKDLSEKNPEKYHEMWKAYEAYEKNNGVVRVPTVKPKK